MLQKGYHKIPSLGVKRGCLGLVLLKDVFCMVWSIFSEILVLSSNFALYLQFFNEWTRLCVLQRWAKPAGKSEVLPGVVLGSGFPSENLRGFRWLYFELNQLEIEWKLAIVLSKLSNHTQKTLFLNKRNKKN